MLDCTTTIHTANEFEMSLKTAHLEKNKPALVNSCSSQKRKLMTVLETKKQALFSAIFK